MMDAWACCAEMELQRWEAEVGSAGRGGRLPARATGKDPCKGVSPVCPAAMAWEERRGKDMGHLRRVRMNQVD